MLHREHAGVQELVVLERADLLSHVVVARHRKVAAEEVGLLLSEGRGARQQASREHQGEASRRSGAHAPAARQLTSISADSV